MPINFSDIMMSRAIDKAKRPGPEFTFSKKMTPLPAQGSSWNAKPRPSISKDTVKRRAKKSSPQGSKSGGSRAITKSQAPIPDIEWFLRKLTPDVAQLGKKNGRF